MNNDEKILNELVEIRKLLTIFAQDKLDEFNEKIRVKYLTTPERQQMYDLFDGEKTLKDIAVEIKISAEAVRKFAVALEKDGLITYIKPDAKSKCPKRLF